MNSNGISLNNTAVAALPKHLLQFAVDQRYDDYTPVDHAVWRFIMRQNIFFLKEYAHKVYFQGLLDTGISFERIPRIQEMNDILGKIGWGAVAVDGFIPPAAFMEFQAYKVLVIACDMRQIHHIEYTPAPDIVHEAAGHAPIIVDQEYSNYLQRFGEVGAKAMSSKKDFELYEAIRHLSILKELPNPDPKELDEGDEAGRRAAKEPGRTFGDGAALAAALVDGRIRPDRHAREPKIYGAGLLSSIGESVSCLEPNVKKIPYSIDAADTAFDITTKQPQLFVCRDFKHLTDVLEEFASKMAFRVGGLEGINKAIECKNTATCEYSSGLQVSGVFTEVLTDENGAPIYLRTTGPSALAFGTRNCRARPRLSQGRLWFADRELEGPAKRPRHCPTSNCAASASRRKGGDARDSRAVSSSRAGRENPAPRRQAAADHILQLQREARRSRLVRSEPGALTTWRWASASARSSTAPPTRTPYNQVALVPKERTIKVPVGRETEEARKSLRSRCARFANARSATSGSAKSGRRSRPNIPTTGCSRWRFSKSSTRPAEQNALKQKIVTFLNEKKLIDKDNATLIEWGFRLVTYHKADLQTAG